ncbi:F-box only protein 7-like [Oryzias melastigma]|uniref:F-box only protein 7-like n=1 Tax=Oryzias melastigma TaxID=30732 RepID=UPI00168D7E6F|nr:F-box only protein 7-like [Oryzias melastigma]
MLFERGSCDLICSMKLRVRIRRQTSRLEVGGEAPTLRELVELIGETLLPSHGLSADTDFGLSLNGSDLLSDSTQTLQSCGIDSGDLIWVLLPSAGPESKTGSSSAGSSSTTGAQQSSSSTSSSTCSSTCSQRSDSMEPAGPAPPDASAAPLWEPILCSEAENGHAPLSLDLLFHAAQVSCPNDAVVVAAHTLLLEAGFTPQGCELKAAQMPAGWRSGATYRLQYTHPLCGSSSASVVGVVMGPQLVINAALTVLENVALVRKLQLTASSFVTEEWAGSAAAAFKDLRKLSRLVKDQLAYPLIAAAREAAALPWAFGLQALPPELLLRVLRLLDVRSLVRLSAVCRLLNAAAADSSLWRHLYRRDFPGSGGNGSRDSDWKELYKRSFVFRAESRRRSTAFLVTPPLFDPHIFHPVPRPFPPVPGIIGGDYDQRPNLPYGLLPRPRYDPIGPLSDPFARPRFRPSGGGADVRRGFI